MASRRVSVDLAVVRRGDGGCSAGAGGPTGSLACLALQAEPPT